MAERSGCPRLGAAAAPPSRGSANREAAPGQSTKSRARGAQATLAPAQRPAGWDSSGLVMKVGIQQAARNWAEETNPTFPGHVGALPVIQQGCFQAHQASLECHSGGRWLLLQAAHRHNDYKWSRALLTFALRREPHHTPAPPHLRSLYCTTPKCIILYAPWQPTHRPNGLSCLVFLTPFNSRCYHHPRKSQAETCLSLIWQQARLFFRLERSVQCQARMPECLIGSYARHGR